MLEGVPSRGTSEVLAARLGRAQAKGLIECYEPATGRPLGSVEVTPPAQVGAVIARARQAQAAWSQSSFAERRKLIGLVRDHVLRHCDELCDVVVRDTGKTRHNAMLGEIWPVVEKARWTMARGERYLRPEPVSPGLLLHKKARVEYPPLGVIGIITPWNYPLQNILGPALPALMAGNAVIVKVSEWVAWSSQRFQRIFDEALDQAGYPRDLVQIINGYAETGAALVSGGVDKIIFTGSLENGKRVLAEAAETVTPVVLELGGKDPLIVCDDAHLEQAVHAALTGCFINCGQNCLASERILVFDAVYEAFAARVADAARALRQGPPDQGDRVDLAAIVSPLQLDLIERLVNDAVQRGARVLCGGRRALPEQGQFYAPTVLADVTPDMPIAQEELFGPVMLLMRVRDEQHALQVANGTAFGLCATVLSRDPARARRISQQVVAGNISINEFGLTYMAMDLPFGGVRGSGFGRLNGKEGLRACTNIKAVLDDRLPISLPAKVFPVREGATALAREVLQLVYAGGARRKLAAATRLAKLLAGRGRA